MRHLPSELVFSRAKASTCSRHYYLTRVAEQVFSYLVRKRVANPTGRCVQLFKELAEGSKQPEQGAPMRPLNS